MDKSPEAFRTISEVADFLDTPAHVLRFWESRFPQIRPVKRAGGRRYYRPGDVALLAGIKKLLHDEGMTIRGVQKILREQGIRHVASLGSGDASPAGLDSDIEAVLSAEYGLSSRPPMEDRLSPEALQSAQIISLETALNRQEGARPAAPGQSELWPPAPPGSPSERDEADAWPGDPEDWAEAGAEQEPTGAAEMTDAFSPVSGDGSTPSSVPEAVAADTGSALPDAPSEHGEPVPSVDGGASETAMPEVETASDDSSPATPDAATETVDEGPTATVAALLRRVSPGQIAAVQPDLIALRDRLIDLRGRVAEAARRRAK